MLNNEQSGYKEVYETREEIIIDLKLEASLNIPSKEQALEMAKQIFDETPLDNTELSTLLESLYQRQYKERATILVKPPHMDYLHQQYGLKRDETDGKRRFNCFGNFAVDYFEGLSSMDKWDGYLGRGRWEHRSEGDFTAVLLGSSSMTTTNQFFAFVDTINPDVTSTVIDLDPFAVRLAKEAQLEENSKNHIIAQADANHLPLATGSVDFLATNFLLDNLKVHSRDIADVSALLNEAARALSERGRLIMVEQLNNDQLHWLADRAYESGLKFATTSADGRGGMLKTAHLLPSDTTFENMLEDIEIVLEEFVYDVEHSKVNELPSPLKAIKSDEVPQVRCLIFMRK